LRLRHLHTSRLVSNKNRFPMRAYLA
jgi:hypothetical protein